MRSATAPPNGIPSNVGAIRPMMLILMALFVMVGVGMVTNSLSNSGLMNLNNPTPSYSCTVNNYLHCSIPIETGCNENPANCNIGGASGINSIFNPSSPFTAVLEGNIFGLFHDLTSSGVAVTHGPFDTLGSGTYYTASCYVGGDLQKGLNFWYFDSCTSTNPDGSNQTQSQSFNSTNFNSNYANATKLTPFFNLMNNETLDSTFGCNNEGQINYTTGDSTNGYTLYGCAIGDEISTPIWSFMISIPNSIGALSVTYPHYQHENVFVIPIDWYSIDCYPAYYNPSLYTQPWEQPGPECLGMINTLDNPPTSAGGGLNFGLFTPLLGFIVGVVLFLIGLNLTVQAGGSIFGSGTNVLVGTGPQGARLAQSLGIALIVWSPMYSVFGNWMTSALLGSTGLEVLITFVITGVFFFGAFWQALSYN